MHGATELELSADSCTVLTALQVARVAAMQRVVGPALASLSISSKFVPHLHSLSTLEALYLDLPRPRLSETSQPMDLHPLSTLLRLRDLHIEGGCDTLLQGVHKLASLETLVLEYAFPDEPLLPSTLKSLQLESDFPDQEVPAQFPVAAALQAFAGSLQSLSLLTAFTQFGDNDMAALAAVPGLQGLSYLSLGALGGCAPQPCALPFAALSCLDINLHYWSGEEQPAWDFGRCEALKVLRFGLDECQGNVDLRKCTNVQARSLVFSIHTGSEEDQSARCVLDLRTWSVQRVTISFESYGDDADPGAPLSATDVLGVVLAAQPPIPMVEFDSRRLRG